MDVLIESLWQDADSVLRLLPRVLAGLLLVALAGGLGRAVSRWVERALQRRQAEAHRLPLFAVRGLVIGLFLLPAFSVALNMVGLRAAAVSVLATGGVAAVVIGLASQKIGENLLAGLALSTARSFDVGDLIEVAGHRGRVEEVTLRQVQIRTAVGCDVFIPSGELFRSPLMNFTRDGLRRLDFTLGVDYAADLPAARDLILSEIRGIPGVLQDPGPQVAVQELSPEFVTLEATFWCDYYRQERPMGTVRTECMEASVKALRERGFTLSSDVTASIQLTKVDNEL